MNEREQQLADEHRHIRRQRLARARAIATHSPLEWEMLKQEFGNRCVRCDALCTPIKDHIVPLYQGGSDGIENIQPLCVRCNASKGPDSTDYRAKRRAQRARYRVIVQEKIFNEHDVRADAEHEVSKLARIGMVGTITEIPYAIR